MVFAGFFPTDPAEYESMRDALSKLHLNDSSFQFEPDTSDALGFGFRCGFLGLLHMEIIQERLEREHDLDLITTAPSVVYHAHTKTGEMIRVDNPSKMPPVGNLESIEEPLLKLTVPGIPDIYQGDELLCLSLVDPDNRRPVDWDARRAALRDPPPKLQLIRRALALRARRPGAFAGSYEPVSAGSHVVAFVRGDEVFVAARLRGEAPFTLPDGDWSDALDLDYEEFGIALYERS